MGAKPVQRGIRRRSDAQRRRLAAQPPKTHSACSLRCTGPLQRAVAYRPCEVRTLNTTVGGTRTRDHPKRVGWLRKLNFPARKHVHVILDRVRTSRPIDRQYRSPSYYLWPPAGTADLVPAPPASDASAVVDQRTMARPLTTISRCHHPGGSAAAVSSTQPRLARPSLPAAVNRERRTLPPSPQRISAGRKDTRK